MNNNKLMEILDKRDEKHVKIINISPRGHALTPTEAHELEIAGHGETHGGDNGFFWLFPIYKEDSGMTRKEFIEIVNTTANDPMLKIKTGNPLHDFTRFIEKLDINARRHIGDELEKQGRNRYTGEAEAETGQQTLEGC